MSGWFITGTDTGVGKTRTACLLLRALTRAGHSAVGMKPVASGCHATADGWRSDDALALIEAGGVPVGYDDVNPYALRSACAPHVAAREMGVEVKLETILQRYENLRQRHDYVVVEGVGGWMVPLNDRLTMADVARALDLPVVIVVGLRLGCLNHTLLTAQAIERAGLTLAGWIANLIDPAMTHVPENVRTLERSLRAPMLAQWPHQPVENSPPAPALNAESFLRLTSRN